jgi:hypothetical protein
MGVIIARHAAINYLVYLYNKIDHMICRLASRISISQVFYLNAFTCQSSAFRQTHKLVPELLRSPFEEN